ncbi:MAG: tRNA 2-thiouridine(34) synthase MnmA [Bacilli bacterium]|nr:tRNA 2-thiouridine(34) synthase MnmA [Bacilli bacterium]MDD4795844.1 tRNA 2-thiouridine(34) synthase MnmA [Bacilli bacterium]
MKKVVIGMSGGVDSSVAAYLLQKKGYEVIGLFMRNWDSTVNNDSLGNPNLDAPICPQEQDYNDAKEVCDKLGIPLYRVDFVKEYWEYVFKYFLDELERGRTPNPDLMCNKYIKFDLFIKEAKKLGADYIATGHYARIVGTSLLRALDLNKDQTYFLAALAPNQLKNVLFPLGEITKPEVRKIAGEIGLSTAKKKDSTGICFIGERNYQKFIANYLKPNPGKIIDLKINQVVGEHTGLMNYTIGQRRNVGISGNPDKHYVVGKNVKENILYIAFGDDNHYLYSDACLVDNVNFISETKPNFCTAKFRYRGPDVEVILEYLDNNEIIVKYPSKVKAVTPGQACVFYLGEECLGSGIIKDIYLEEEKLDYL